MNNNNERTELHIGDVVYIRENTNIDFDIELKKNRFAVVVSEKPLIAPNRLMVVYLTSQSKYANKELYPEYIELEGLSLSDKPDSSISQKRSFCDNFIYTINSNRVLKVVDKLSAKNLSILLNNIGIKILPDNSLSNDQLLKLIDYKTKYDFDNTLFNLIRTRNTLDEYVSNSDKRLEIIKEDLKFIDDPEREKIIKNISTAIENNSNKYIKMIESMLVVDEKQKEIDNKPKRLSERLNYNKVVKYYIEQDLSLVKTCEKLNCKYNTLYCYLKRHNLYKDKDKKKKGVK